MNQFVVVCLTIGLSFLWRMIATKKMRDFMMPWTFAWIFFNMACICFVPGIFRTLMAITNYIATAILIDGFAAGDRHRNGSWGAFVFFWIYVIISCLFGYHKFMGMVFWINAFLVSYGSGYYFSRWLVNNERGMKRLQFAFLAFSCIMILLYARHGGVAAVGETGRATFDTETMHQDAIVNENYTALTMLCFIPMLLVILFQAMRFKNGMIMTFLTFVCLVFCGLVLVRAGSRNGFVGLLPSFWYVLFSTTNRVQRRKRILLFVVAAIVFLPIMFRMMRGVQSLRIIDFSGQELSASNMDKSDMITSGRLGLWRDHVREMSTFDRLIGRGLRKNDFIASRGQATVGNAHSAYMTIFYNSGMLGWLLLLIFLIKSTFMGLGMGDRGRIALLFIWTWFLSGAGESLPVQGGVGGALAGLGMGLLCAGSIKDQMLMNNRDRSHFYGMWTR